MARYSASAVTGAGSATLPIFGLHNTATVNGQLVEIGVFNTTATAVQFEILRVSTIGTGTAVTAVLHEAQAAAAACLPKRDFTSTAPTKITGAAYTFHVAAGAGNGVVLTFGGVGLSTGVAGTGNGLCLFPIGTGQACAVTFVWEE
jgi:hypothetical protein